MLSNMWILPGLMVAAFVIILFFGKKLPQGGWWVGQLAITACLALSVVGGIQWQNTEKVAVVHHEAGAEGAAEGAGHSAEAGAEGEDHSAEGGAEGAVAGEGETHTEAPVEGEVATHASASSVSSASAGRGFAIVAAEKEEGPAKLRTPVRNIVTWFTDGNVNITLGTHVDGFALAMLFVVCFISFCVHVFSREYLRGDIRFTHYYASLALFTGAMLWMVQSATTLGLLFGWEMMGLCSFLLIGHWWEDETNTNAALKAFFTTRTGDIGLLIGIIILFFASGQTFDIAKTNELALNGGISQSNLTLAAICLFCGVVGKVANREGTKRPRHELAKATHAVHLKGVVRSGVSNRACPLEEEGLEECVSEEVEQRASPCTNREAHDHVTELGNCGVRQHLFDVGLHERQQRRHDKGDRADPCTKVHATSSDREAFKEHAVHAADQVHTGDNHGGCVDQ